MAGKTEKKQADKVGNTQEQPVKAAAKKKFPIEKLRANCKELFGVTDCTFAGATHGMAGDYTVDEVKAQVEKWRRTEVKNNGRRNIQ